MAHEWADRREARRPYELSAREIMPVFQGSADRAHAGGQWAIDNRPRFVGDAGAATMSAIQQHAEEQRSADAPAGDGAAETTAEPAG